MNYIKLIILSIMTLLWLAFVIGGFPMETRTYETKCYDRYSSEIQGLICYKETTCGLLDSYTKGCDNYFEWYAKEYDVRFVKDDLGVKA